MKLLFSESKADYGHYIFPYAIWAFPEPGETPGDLLNQGFLPSSRELDRFYLCRQIRVALARFRPSSENRRILRKGEGIVAALVPRAEFEYTPQRRQFYKQYADARFGQGVMSFDRLDSLFAGKITSHLLTFTDTRSGAEVGTVTCYVEPTSMVYYYYAFYDLNYHSRNLGMFMMTSGVGFFAERGFRFLYLGSCYLPNAVYKTQFAGAEFFNGVCWSANLGELKFLLERGQHEQRQHLLENEAYRDRFLGRSLAEISSCASLSVRIKHPGAHCENLGPDQGRECTP
jgi:arginyl-tRNA--protein-N-Asp/Glu arginylyltransferase